MGPYVAHQHEELHVHVLKCPVQTDQYFEVCYNSESITELNPSVDMLAASGIILAP